LSLLAKPPLLSENLRERRREVRSRPQTEIDEDFLVSLARTVDRVGRSVGGEGRERRARGRGR